MKRLLGYLKPHIFVMIFVSIVVLLITAVELYKPIIIGNAIDYYINGYYNPYAVVDSDAPQAVPYKDVYISKSFDKSTSVASNNASTNNAEGNYYQMFLYEDHYYMAEKLTKAQCEELKNADLNLLSQYASQYEPLTKAELKVLRHYDFTGICKAALLYLGALTVGFLLNLVQTYSLQKMGQDIVFSMREQMFSHVHSLSLNYFNTQPVGKLVTRVTNDTEAVNEMFSSVLVRLFKNIVKIIGYAVVMVRLNAKLAGFSFLLLPLIGGLTFLFRHLSREAYRFTRNKLTDLNTFLSENISGMKLIQIFTKEKDKYNEFEDKSKGLLKAGYKELMVFAIFRPIIYWLSVVALIIIIYNGGNYALTGVISIGTLYIFINYISSFFDPIQELAEQFGTLQSSLASAEKMFQILDEKPEIVNCDHPVDVKINGRIEFRNVWFAYEKDEYILKDVSFTIEPGQKVAFVGATGAGKSSILNLIGRYFDIQKGEILIDGVNIKDIDTDVLRGAIGQVQQDVFLFTGDIKGNISLRNENITIDEIKEAAKYVNADQFIAKLPGGYDEPVTERGSTLSAGQRQLISFARTLAYKPTILVLDEATANIDTETESLITEAMEKLMRGRTTIMVAHRLSTIQHADKIMVMDKGQIVESGNHQELLAQNGVYHKLYELQLVDK